MEGIDAFRVFLVKKPMDFVVAHERQKSERNGLEEVEN
jgi:hypothetical protein